MNALLSKVKSKNKFKNNKNKIFLWAIFTMISLGVILLVVDVDTFSTVSAFLIFFAFIGLIITLFRIALVASKRRKIKISNSVDIVYQNEIENFNFKNGTSYTFSTNKADEEKWMLVPSYANYEVHYTLEDKDKNIKMYHGTAYNVFGAEQRRTYYFQGLYIIMDGPEGDFQYRDKASISGFIIENLKSVHASDDFDVSRYAYKSTYQEGKLYNQKDDHKPLILDGLLKLLRSFPFVENIKIGLYKERLHIAIEQKGMRLPYVKNYKEDELMKIEKVVYENASLLDKVRQSIWVLKKSFDFLFYF